MPFVIVLCVLLVLIVAMGAYLAYFSMRIQRQTLAQAKAWQETHYDISWYDPLPKKDYTIQCADGYVLHVQLLRNPEPTTRYIILSHGYTDNRFGSLKYTKLYLDLGFNVVLYDLRGHGANDRTFCTYSIRESSDLNELIQDTRRRYADLTELGIHGESLGSATSIAVLKYHPMIDFVVADCGFSEIQSVMKAGLRGMHLPTCLVYIASLCVKVRYGYFYHEMQPILSLKDNTLPILLIHGEQDDFILPEHSRRMQAATQGYSELHLIPGAGHAASVLTDPESYREDVQAFLEKVEAMRREAV